MSVAPAIEAAELRRQRGLAIAAVSKVTEKKPGIWVVPSQSGTGNYWVRSDGDRLTCTCPDFDARDRPCKHIFAVEFTIRRETSPDGDETTAETVTATRTAKTVADRPTYKQDWTAYNAAQRNEKPKFQALMHSLCQGIDEPPQVTGRPRQSLRDMVFSAAFKVYSTVSGRRFMGDLADAAAKGYVSRPAHYNTISKYLEMPGLTPILRRLVTESALPLKSVETEFAVDSSGFSTSRFVRWYDHKYGRPVAEYDWVKVSLVCGVKTNVVTAVVVDEKKGGDSPQFAPLVKATAENFAIHEVTADAAYASYDNMDLVGSLGGMPFIAFRSNAKPSKPGLYAEMFHYYNFRRDEFLAHYHKRSNVETTFSMVKAKFGDSLRSKTDTAMVNEALCKILCHNVCCLIQSTYELGIEATFWVDLERPSSVSPAEHTEDDPEVWSWV